MSVHPSWVRALMATASTSQSASRSSQSCFAVSCSKATRTTLCTKGGVLAMGAKRSSRRAKLSASTTRSSCTTVAIVSPLAQPRNWLK